MARPRRCLPAALLRALGAATMFRATFLAAGRAQVPLGRSQAVRQRILIPPCEGSIPSAPANRFNAL
jgi:hypothetical protein